MNSQDFLTLNLVGAGAFIVWYVVSRGSSRRPTQLNLKARDRAPLLMNPEGSVDQARSLSAKESISSQRIQRVHPDLVGAKTKSLNVMFNYNGHSWDAYEVLGVPAGSSIKTVTEAYQGAILRSASKGSYDFLETAYKAILNKVS